MFSRFNVPALALIAIGYFGLIAIGILARVEPARHALFG